MKFLVLGAGAIGSVFGGLLRKSGHDVCLVGRKAHIQAINSTGLLIDGIWGKYTVKNIKGYTSLKDVLDAAKVTFDTVLLTVKSYDTEYMLTELKQYIKNPPPVLSLQNGLGNVEKIRDYIGAKKTIGGRVIFGVEYIKPGHVTVTVEADKTIIGALQNSIEMNFLEQLAETFTKAGIATDVTEDINRYIWGKVLYNCSLNGLAAIADVNYGKLLSYKGTRMIMKQIVKEIFTLAKALDIYLGWDTPEEYTNHLFEELIPKTFDHHPSMLQDMSYGKKTEIAALNGAITTMGDEQGIELTCNKGITSLIVAKEMINKRQTTHSKN